MTEVTVEGGAFISRERAGCVPRPSRVIAEQTALEYNKRACRSPRDHRLLEPGLRQLSRRTRLYRLQVSSPLLRRVQASVNTARA